MSEGASPEIDFEAAFREKRPDDDLPPELKHEEILKVRDVSSWNFEAYQIVFNKTFMPYGYWNPQPEGWEMHYARIEWHNTNFGLLRLLTMKSPCITIVVKREGEDELFE